MTTGNKSARDPGRVVRYVGLLLAALLISGCLGSSTSTHVEETYTVGDVTFETVARVPTSGSAFVVVDVVDVGTGASVLLLRYEGNSTSHSPRFDVWVIDKDGEIRRPVALPSGLDDVNAQDQSIRARAGDISFDPSRRSGETQVVEGVTDVTNLSTGSRIVIAWGAVDGDVRIGAPKGSGLRIELTRGNATFMPLSAAGGGVDAQAPFFGVRQGESLRASVPSESMLVGALAVAPEYGNATVTLETADWTRTVHGLGPIPRKLVLFAATDWVNVGIDTVGTRALRGSLMVLEAPPGLFAPDTWLDSWPTFENGP